MDLQSNSEIIVFSPSRNWRKITQIIFLVASISFAIFSWIFFKYGPGGKVTLIVGLGAAAGSLISAIAALTDIFLGHKIRVCLGENFLIVGNYGSDKHIPLSEIKDRLFGNSRGTG